MQGHGLEHNLNDWLSALPNLKRSGGEYKGPCPLCGGTDRFHVRQGDGRVLAGCRQCKASFGQLARAVFGDRRGEGRPHADIDRKQAEARQAERRRESAGKATLASRLWAACVDPNDTPARTYLASRFAWPPAGIGPALPDGVGWLDRARQPAKAGAWHGLPPGAAGALAFAYRPAGDGDVTAVSMEALTATGERMAPDRWRRTFGERQGAVFAVKGEGDGVVLCEGEVDALALHLAGGFAEARAVGGTSGMTLAACKGAESVVIVADGDSEGRRAAWRLRESLLRAQLIDTGAGGDPATWLANWFEERAAITEFDGGLERGKAEAAAWEAVLNEIQRGARLVTTS